MTDFTKLFFETLNASIATMVTDALKAKDIKIQELEDTIAKIKNIQTDHARELDALSDHINDHDRLFDGVDSAIEKYIDGMDFSDIVRDNQHEDTYESPEFADAVKEALINAIR